ncbi:hypothetical protein DERP_001612 [Dermatophagoides pteronyssinus]|uniref:Uncharacterized protein n=1 Tax=Dermatophagoides pteronyssinus TaxID=6956 RepID=A0ABQ8JB10_DERPT|nr:hypothetical protein DERP_001612 [Dermatophagoides pteronyssinus]
MEKKQQQLDSVNSMIYPMIDHIDYDIERIRNIVKTNNNQSVNRGHVSAIILCGIRNGRKEEEEEEKKSKLIERFCRFCVYDKEEEINK